MNKQLMLIASLALLLSCRQRTQGFNTYFWLSNKPNSDYHLFIDGKDSGLLPYLAEAPDCNDLSLKEKTLFLPLPSGNYDIEIKDGAGKLHYTEQFKIKRSAGSTSISTTENWDGGGSRQSFKNDCLVKEIQCQ